MSEIQKSNRYSAHIFLGLANLIYGANYTIAKVAMPAYIEPLAFIVIRVSVAATMFWIFQSLFVRESVDRKDLPYLFFCGLFGVAINQMFFFKGLSITTEINASLIMITTPIIVLLVSNLLIKEPITRFKILGVCLGAIGVTALILKGNTSGLSKDGLLGDLFVLINATSYALYLVLIKPLMKKYHPITIVKWVFFFGFFMVLPFGVGGLPRVDWGHLPFHVWGSIGYVVICTTFFAYLFNSWAMKTANPSLVSIYIYTQPIIAGAIAIAIGNDQPTWVKLLSGLLIFAGVYFVSKPDQKEKKITT